MPNPALAELSASLDFSSVRRGEFIVKAGEKGDSMCVIVTGRARVVITHTSGREITLGTLYPKDFLGEMSLFDARPRSASVQALEPCEVLRIRKKVFLDILHNNNAAAMSVIGCLVTRLRTADAQIESLALFDVYGRVARLLLERRKRVGLDNVIIPAPKRADMAKMLGTTRETVTRVMKEFEKRGYIRIEKKRILLLDEGWMVHDLGYS